MVAYSVLCGRHILSKKGYSYKFNEKETFRRNSESIGAKFQLKCNDEVVISDLSIKTNNKSFHNKSNIHSKTKKNKGKFN